MRAWIAIFLFAPIIYQMGCGAFVGEDRLQCTEDEDCPSGHICFINQCGPAPATDGGEAGSDGGQGGTDAGQPSDAGATSEAGMTQDAGAIGDGGLFSDGGNPLDAAIPLDSGTNLPESGLSSADSGAPPDAATVVDAAVSPDAGALGDAGAPVDAGPPQDAGPFTDGGTPDAALGDSGIQPADIWLDVSGYGSVMPLGVELKINGLTTTTMNVDRNGNIILGSGLTPGDMFAVGLTQQPTFPAQTCTEMNASGTLVAGMNTVTISCTTQGYTTGYTVVGDVPSDVGISDGWSSTLVMAGMTQGMLPLPVEDGRLYEFSVATQPTDPAHRCWFRNSRGWIQGANVTKPRLVCATIGFDVDTLSDALDSNLGDGICETADMDCSLRAAINEASLFDEPIWIGLPVGNILLNLGPVDGIAAEIDVGDLDVIMSGSVATDILIEGTGEEGSIITGNTTDRVFDLHDEANVVLQKLTIQNGGVGNIGLGVQGAGINARNGSYVELKEVLLMDNDTVGSGQFGGGMFIAGGARALLSRVRLNGNHSATWAGGIRANGVLDVFDSAFTGNIGTQGGGLFVGHVSARIFLANTTFSQNSAPSGGGAIKVDLGEADFLHVTITENDSGANSALRVEGTAQANLYNTAVGGNSGGTEPDCQAGNLSALSTYGRNFLATYGGCGGNFSNRDTLPSPMGPDLLIEVGPLGVDVDYGVGHVPGPSSALLDEANDSICPQEDQRGITRPQPGNPRCDIGAIER
jgi:predicted outer membrane repeat protein